MVPAAHTPPEATLGGATATGPGVTLVTVVGSPGCHFCADAEAVLAELRREFPLRITVVDASEPTGMRLVAAHRPSMYPLVLVDGAFFSQGRLPRRKLCALLTRRAGVAPR